MVGAVLTAHDHASAGRRAALSTSLVVYALTTLLVVHASFRGLHADLDAAIYAAWYTELGTLSPQDFVDRLQASGWIFQARDQSIAKFESGFAALSWALAYIGLPIQAYFTVIAALSLYPKASVALRFSSHPALSVIWYASFCYLLLEMNAIRAGLAAALMIAALPSYFERRWLRYGLMIALAATFHTAALFALTLPAWRALSRRGGRLALAVCLAVALSLVDVTALLGVLGGMFEKIAEYKAAFDAGFGDVAYLRLNPVNSSSVPFMLVGAMLAYKAYGAQTARNELDRFGATMVLLPMMALFALSSFPIIGARMAELLCIYQLVFVTRLVDQYPGLGLGRWVLVLTLMIQFVIQQFLTLNVDALYFIGPAKPDMLLLIEQKSVIDAILAEILSNL